MRRRTLAVVAMLMVLGIALTGCGQKQPAAGGGAGGGSAGGAAGGATGAPAQGATGASGGAPAQGTAATETFTLRLGSLNPDSHPYNVHAKEFADEVEQKTNGAVKVQIFGNGVLGDGPSEIEGLQLGSIDFHVSSIAPLANFVPEAGLFNLPYIFRDRAQAYKVLDGDVGADVAKKAEAKGLKLLAYWEQGFRHMTNNVRPIRTPADVKGLKMRVQQSPVYVKLFQSLDATSVPIAYNELYTALQQRTVDGQEQPLVNIWVQKFYEVQKHISLTGHTYEPVPFLMSLKTWNRLPEPYRKVIQEAVLRVRDKERQVMAQQDDDLLKKLDATGVTIVKDPDREAFAKVLREKMWPQFYDKYSQELVQRVYNTK